MVCATSEAWMRCSMTMVAFLFIFVCGASSWASSLKALFQRSFLLAPNSLSMMSVARTTVFHSNGDGKREPIATLRGIYSRTRRDFDLASLTIDDKLPEPGKLFLVAANAITKLFILAAHQKIPCKINWILLGNRLILVHMGQRIVFFDKDCIWDTCLMDNNEAFKMWETIRFIQQVPPTRKRTFSSEEARSKPKERTLVIQIMDQSWKCTCELGQGIRSYAKCMVVLFSL